MAKKNFSLWMAGIVLAVGMLHISCGTMFHARKVQLNSLSGAVANIKVVEDGVVIYDGQLPASVKVKGGNKNYTVFYTDKNGNETSMMMTKKFNGWFIANLLILPGFIVDFVTGHIYTLNKKVMVPVSYQEIEEFPFVFVEGIPAEHLEGLTVVGNIYSNTVQ
jgi:hypothetical protein